MCDEKHPGMCDKKQVVPCDEFPQQTTSLINKSIMALVYKLIDNMSFNSKMGDFAHEVGQVTLYGGIVRDVIVPAFHRGEDPFSTAAILKLNEPIADIDISIRLVNEELGKACICESKHRTTIPPCYLKDKLMELFLPKLREWDWILMKIPEFDQEYGIELIRFHIQHVLTGVKTQIDVTHSSWKAHLDADVNGFLFNRDKGLFYRESEDYHFLTVSMKIKEQHRIREIEKQIMEKKCEMVCNLNAQIEDWKNETLIKKFRRLTKLIEKGWTVTNLIPAVYKKEKHDDPNCVVCQEESSLAFFFDCSNCVICTGCIENMIKVSEIGEIICPTCRKPLNFWIKH